MWQEATKTWPRLSTSLYHIAIRELAKQKRIPIAGCYHKSHSLNRRLHNLTDKQTNELAIAFEQELSSLEKEKQTTTSERKRKKKKERENTRCPTLSRKQKLIAKY